MDTSRAGWILILTIVGFCQFLAADTASSLEDAAKPEDNVVVSDTDDKTLTDVLEAEQMSQTDKMNDVKRNFGRWRNANWNKGKRNLGRWKNRRWQTLRLQDGDDAFIGQHSLNKRFSDRAINIDLDLPYEIYADSNSGLLDPAYLFGGSVDGLADNSMYENDLDKRHASRWNIIHRKLASLASNEKRNLESIDDEKRMDSRWRLIQNKLNELNGIPDIPGKRSLGRWRNQNWRMRQSRVQDDHPMNLQKRNFGRWKNRNWFLRQFASE